MGARLFLEEAAAGPAAEGRSTVTIRPLRGFGANPSRRGSSRSAPFFPTCLRPLLLLLLLLSLPAPTRPDLDGDPYRILGVPRGATSADIKVAYRRKARDTHPDKNPGKDPDEAAAEFRRVVDSFELLSDEGRRSRYDRTGRTDSGGGFSGGGGGGARRGGGNTWSWTFTFQNGRFYAYNGGGGGQQHRRETRAERQKRLLRNRRDVRQAKARVIRISSLSQLRNVILDESTGLLERSLLLCFVAPGETDRIADGDVLFPFPFAGMSPQNIWWEDLLQTALVKYSGTSDLSQFFGLPPSDKLTEPVFAFVRRGHRLSEYVKLSTSTRETYESWVWQNLNVKVRWLNNHTSPVEIYWINHRSAKLQGTILPGDALTQNTMLSHEFWARDERVDRLDARTNMGRGKLSTNSSLGTWKILSDDRDTFVINTRCADLSGHCEFWVRAAPGECQRNPRFMLINCKRTCQVCGEDEPLFVSDWPAGVGSTHDEL